MNIILKPCPFCGHGAAITYNTEHGYIPFCTNDDCFLNEIDHGFITEEKAIEHWNRRMDNSDRIIERMNKSLNTFRDLRDLCVDYDGFNDPDGLKSLIDDIRQIAIDHINEEESIK